MKVDMLYGQLLTNEQEEIMLKVFDTASQERFSSLRASLTESLDQIFSESSYLE